MYIYKYAHIRPYTPIMLFLEPLEVACNMCTYFNMYVFVYMNTIYVYVYVCMNSHTHTHAQVFHMQQELSTSVSYWQYKERQVNVFF